MPDLGAGLVTREMAAAHVLEHCPAKVDVSSFDRGPASEFICGGGRCPAPDPTPEEFRRRVEEAAWRAASESGDGPVRRIETEYVR